MCAGDNLTPLRKMSPLSACFQICSKGCRNNILKSSALVIPAPLRLNLFSPLQGFKSIYRNNSITSPIKLLDFLIMSMPLFFIFLLDLLFIASEFIAIPTDAPIMLPMIKPRVKLFLIIVSPLS